MLAERLALPFARMLVVAFSVTATTTGIAILGFHATVITLRVLASLVMNHADFLAMDAFAALTAVVAFVAVPAVLAIVLVTAFGTGFGLALLLGRRALLFRILLFAGLPIGLATLIGTLVGAPLAIVGSTLFAGFGTLLLMQPRVLFATLVVALLLVLLALLLLDFRMFPTMLACLVFAVVAAFELGGATFGAILFRFETLLAFGDFGALFTSLAIRTVLAFGLERLAAFVLAPVLVASTGTVASGAPAVFRGTVADLAMLPATRIARRLGLLKRPTETRFADSPTNSNTSGESWVTSIGLTSVRPHAACGGCGGAGSAARWSPHHRMAGSRGTSGAVKERFRVLRSSTCTTSSTPDTSMPRAATSVATMTFTSPDSKAARLRSRWFWLRLPCSSAAGMPFFVRSLASFWVWNLVRVNRMRRPLPEARVRTSS